MMGEERQLSEDERAQMRQWLENWRITGPLLEAERSARIAALTDDEAARIALDLWRFARPLEGDDGEGVRTIRDLLQATRDR